MNANRTQLSIVIYSQSARNILLDCGGQLKVAGFGVIRMSTISPDKAKLLQLEAIDLSSLYVAPEIYKGEIFEKRVDVYSFALLIYEMIEGVQPFQPKSPEDAARLMCIEGKRPAFKQRKYPPDLKELIEEGWNPLYNLRPTFSEVILRLDKIILNCCKQGWWKDTFKLPWK